jgi:hypothetical protein
MRKWQHGWLHRRKRHGRISFAGVDDFGRIRSGGFWKWKIGSIGALVPESKLRSSLRSAHLPIRTRSNHRYTMDERHRLQGRAGTDQNAFAVSPARETRNANRIAACGAFNRLAELELSFHLQFLADVS